MLAAQHIFLRAPLIEDVDAIYRWENDTKNWEVSGTLKPFTKEEIEIFISGKHDLFLNGQFRYVICLNNSQTPIGTVDFFEFNTTKKTVGIGVLIAEKAFRNKGYAAEAINLITDYCRNELKLVNVFCNIQKDNATSIRLFEKCGFQYVEEKELFGEPVNYYELKL